MKVRQDDRMLSLLSSALRQSKLQRIHDNFDTADTECNDEHTPVTLRMPGINHSSS